MTHKEFCIWLDGFLTNSDWTTIKENDIETIKRKLKSVNKTFSDFNHPPTPHVSPYVVPTNPKKVPYYTLCSCNPANGGSGMCGCVMGNRMVDENYMDKSNFTSTSNCELERLINLQNDINANNN
jgi:hypothetical protein